MNTNSYSQVIGSNLSYPINAGTLVYGSQYTDTKNNSASYGFGNDYGMPSDDIYYKFTLNVATTVSISHCSSSIDTYVYLLSSTGSLLASNDDRGPLCPLTLQASLQVELSPGVYYVVSEGWITITG
ncbi:pre-peptidase C-terminal domain-containing protein, partial [Arcticibacter eurypsychrophilus]|uniref:pre-peptidase C-terminal domain-containing protein n=1 Tax=Arcticibacter eurypsychrophilus TaxID=1434752 RepID=UPI00147F520F